MIDRLSHIKPEVRNFLQVIKVTLLKLWQSSEQNQNIKLFKNTGILSLANVFVKIVAFVIGVLIGRSLGVKAFGDYSLGLAWAAIVLGIAEFGLRIIVRREVARDESLASKYLNNALSLRLISVFLAFLLVAGLTEIFHYSPETQIIILGITVVAIIDSVSQLFIAIFQARERMEFEGLVVFARGILLLGFVLVWLYLGGGLYSLIGLMILVAVIKLGLSYRILVKYFVMPGFYFEFGFWRELLLEAYPLAFVSIFVIIYFRIDSVMLSIYSGEEAVGIYNAAYSFLGGFFVISSAFLTSVFPRFAKAVGQPNKLRRSFQKSLGLMFLFGGSLALVVTFISPFIISVFFGPEFMGKSDRALAILAWAIFFLFLSSTCGVFLNATNHQKVSMYVTGFVAAINVALNLLFIPRWSYIGASVVTVISYFVGFSMMFTFIVTRILREKRVDLTSP